MMTQHPATDVLRVALVGNPNTGKSTLFSALAGVRQHIGNYPGVTVEKKIGRMSHGGTTFELIDLPGTYSLAPRSLDEMVAVDVLLGREDDGAPDAVLCIVDAGNLERNLYLVSQVLEFGLPTVVALNMIDVAKTRGIEIDVAQLSSRLGVPIVPLQANRGIGLSDLKEALQRAGRQPRSTAPSGLFPDAFTEEVRRIEELCREHGGDDPMPRYLAERLLLDTSGYLQGRLFDGAPPETASTVAAEVKASRARLAAAGLPVPACEAMARYDWVGKLLDGPVRRSDVRRVTLSDRIDHLLTNRLWGTLFFVLMMVVVFQSVFKWAGPAMDLISAGVDATAEAVTEAMPEGALRSLVVDGVIAGVGGVAIFLPQVLILFFFIGVLEDCGYMARAAYLMDRLMVRVGLSGKSFIPLLSSFACAIPGVMATRVIENRRDRFTTMMIAPLMSCSARLPVYTLLIAAFVPKRDYLGGVLQLQGLVMFSMYLVGIVAAVGMALLLKRTLLRGPTPPFVMELPAYKIPSPRTVFFRMFDRGWAFVQRAGTLIVAVSIIVWAALYYPHDAATVEEPYAARRTELEQQITDAGESQVPAVVARRTAAEEELVEIDRDIDGAYKRQSYLGRVGHAIEPIVRPLGWDWRIGTAAIASFPAREVVVATLSILYNQGADVDVEVDEDRSRLIGALTDAKWDGTDRPVFGLPTALSLMVFFALCAQCAATLAVIRRETNSWRWPLFTFTYMTVLAYVAALATFQIASYFPA